MTHVLKSWLRGKDISFDTFASEVGLSKPTIWRLMYGTGNITADVIRRVSEGTDFEVSEESLFSAYIDARARRELSDDDGKSTNTTDILVSCEEQG